MSTVAKSLLTEEEYLAKERAADFKSEFYRGEMFAMSGTSYAHTSIKSNLERILGTQLRGGPCRVRSSDLRVRVSGTGLYTYPDLVIVCGKPQFLDNAFDTLLNPRVIIEILSDSTEAYDRGNKFRHYKRIDSLREYVLVAQDRPVIERFAWHEDGEWRASAAEGLEGTLTLGSVEARLPLAEVYEDVDLPANPGR